MKTKPNSADLKRFALAMNKTCGEFVMVPREISERMLEAGKDRMSRARLRELWRDLVNASQVGIDCLQDSRKTPLSNATLHV